VPIPPYDEQVEINRYIAQQLAIITALEHAADEAVGLLKERRSALISAAVTGKIDVRDWQPIDSETMDNYSRETEAACQ